MLHGLLASTTQPFTPAKVYLLQQLQMWRSDTCCYTLTALAAGSLWVRCSCFQLCSSSDRSSYSRYSSDSNST